MDDDDDYYTVQCPCKEYPSHTCKISKPVITKFNLSTRINGSEERNVKLFEYTCEESNHACKVWIDIESGLQKRGECKVCKR